MIFLIPLTASSTPAADLSGGGDALISEKDKARVYYSCLLFLSVLFAIDIISVMKTARKSVCHITCEKGEIVPPKKNHAGKDATAITDIVIDNGVRIVLSLTNEKIKYNISSAGTINQLHNHNEKPALSPVSGCRNKLSIIIPEINSK